jgi:hypothetical protein
MVEKKIEICKQEVQAAQILSKNSKDGGMGIDRQYIIYLSTSRTIWSYSQQRQTFHFGMKDKIVLRRKTYYTNRNQFIS